MCLVKLYFKFESFHLYHLWHKVINYPFLSPQSIVSSPSPSTPPPQPTHKHPQPRRLSSTPKMTSLRSSPPPPPPPDLSLEEAIFDGSRSEKTEMRRSFVDSSSSRRWVELGINHRLTIMEQIVKLIGNKSRLFVFNR